MTLETSGTQTAVVGTEHTLASLTGIKVYVFIVDTVNMAIGDTLTLRIKTKVLGGGVLRTAYIKRFYNAQPIDDPIKISIPIPSDVQADFILKQTTGTGRAFPWKVVSI